MMAREWRSWVCPMLLLLASLGGVGWLNLRPHSGAPVAALFPPWWDSARAEASVVAAGGTLLRLGAWSAVVVTASDDPEFAVRLRAAGAWLVLDPQALGGCLTEARVT